MLSGAEQDSCLQNVDEVDIKDEVSAADTESDSDMSTPIDTTQLSTSSDNVPVDNDNVPVDKGDNVPVDNDNVPVDKDDNVPVDNDNVPVDNSDNVPADSSRRQSTCKICRRHFYVRRIRNHVCKRICITCDLCDVCKPKLSLSSVSKDCRRRGDQQFSCNLCNKKFVHLCLLLRHVRTHTDDRPFTCGICGSKFKNNKSLNEHEHNHIRKPLSCDVCKKIFKEKRSLNIHKRFHASELPFTCSICSCRLWQHSEVILHMKSHAADTWTFP